MFNSLVFIEKKQWVNFNGSDIDGQTPKVKIGNSTIKKVRCS